MQSLVVVAEEYVEDKALNVGLDEEVGVSVGQPEIGCIVVDLLIGLGNSCNLCCVICSEGECEIEII